MNNEPHRARDAARGELLIIYLRNIPTVADAEDYQRQVIAHYKLTADETKGRLFRTEILRTEPEIYLSMDWERLPRPGAAAVALP